MKRTLIFTAILLATACGRSEPSAHPQERRPRDSSSSTVGEHLLVAGDEDFVWECGFTQPYDEGTVSDWREAFRS